MLSLYCIVSVFSFLAILMSYSDKFMLKACQLFFITNFYLVQYYGIAQGSA